MEAVKVRGQALQYASYQSPSLRGDREVLLEAVKQDGDALRHAFVALKRKVLRVLRGVRPLSLMHQLTQPAHTTPASSTTTLHTLLTAC